MLRAAALLIREEQQTQQGGGHEADPGHTGETIDRIHTVTIWLFWHGTHANRTEKIVLRQHVTVKAEKNATRCRNIFFNSLISCRMTPASI